MKVGDICTREVVTVTTDATIVEAARLMREHHVGNVVVIERGGRPRPVGILTDRDIVVSVVAVTPELIGRLLVEEVMSLEPVVARVDESVEEIITRMREEGVRRLPVVADDRLVGIVSFDDVAEYLTTVMGRLMETINTEMWLEERRR